MELIDYIASAERRKLLAEAVQASPDYLWQVATGWIRPKTRKPTRASTTLAQAIEIATAKLGPEVVPKNTLRPDVWPRPSEAA